MCLSSSYYFISICLFEQFNVVSKPQLNILNYLQACGVQMPNTAVLDLPDLPALARTCRPKQRGQLSSTQISLVCPSPVQGQGESLLTAWGWVNSFHEEPLQGTSNERQSRAKLPQLAGKNQCGNRPLGWVLGHHVVRLQAKTAQNKPWAKPEVCSTCGFHRNRENMGRDHKHSWIPRAVPSLAGTPQQNLPLSPGHPPPLLTGTLPPRISKGREQGPGHAEWGQQPQGMFKFIPHSPLQGKSQGWVTSQLHKATLLKQWRRKKKSS